MGIAVRGSSAAPADVDRFRRLLTAVRGAGVTVVGATGTGREEVVDACTAAARELGVPVLRGRVVAGTPYSGFAEAFGQCDVGPLTDFGRHAALLLRGLFRAMATPGWATEALGLADTEHTRLHRAVGAVLDAATGPDGLVLVLRDAHLLDDDALALLDHLTAESRRSRVLVLLSHAPDERLAGLTGPPRPTAEVVRLPVDRATPTRRERTVLAALAEGLTADAIARRLDISPRTVHRHLQHLYRKLGTTDRLATVLRAQELGLLP
ncbi:hypothetical protein GCM10022243_19740 [Saccharothrix violaceirubra]|uniref:DNA-binding CsgD family transcriptional regulator n=1 Tax=Saccharothrix violaceirubra TaxID=413306 RepID=A0A7W7WVB3_9PSEU|nr:LuxR C-terminal-related transcriptional regulator [Saccharothrix violaceirubra]MBB4965120.1 DNA-binding CsgD family transcriptional regulator [Saccharothrix violaceirubra]